MSSPFSRPLPPGANLEQQKKQAKDLLRAFDSDDPEARRRVRALLPDKQRVALGDVQFVLAREYGFEHWAALKERIDAGATDTGPPEARMHDAFQRRDATTIRALFTRYPAFRQMINAPVFAFNSPPIVACANDLAMVDVLLEFGADPNARSEWWAGGFHALYSATGAAADRLIAAGAVPDACAAAHLDRADLLARMIAEDPARVHERGGDGQTPLHFARSRAVVDLLLAAHADINAQDVDHRSTPAEWMLDGTRGAGRYDLAHYLVERGARADVFLASALGLTGQVRAMLEHDPALLDARTGLGAYAEQPPSSHHIYMWTIGDRRSPLDVAAQFEQDETLAMMSAFATPLQRWLVACRRADETAARSLLDGHPGLMESMTPNDHRAIADAAWMGDAGAVGLMVTLGFDPRTTGHDSGTALHCAAWQGSPETVAALLRHPDAPALMAIRDARYGATPLGWCCHGSQFGNTSRDHAGVARLLLGAGAEPGADTSRASPAVDAVLAHAKRL